MNTRRATSELINLLFWSAPRLTKTSGFLDTIVRPSMLEEFANCLPRLSGGAAAASNYSQKEVIAAPNRNRGQTVAVTGVTSENDPGKFPNRTTVPQ